MVDTGKISRTCAQSLTGAGLVLAIAGRASANPTIVQPANPATDTVLALFMANLPIDMLLFSVVFLLVIWKLKSPLRGVPTRANTLIAEVAVAGVAIAVIGALVDFYAFYTEFTVHEYHGYYLDLTWENIALGGAGVFISVYAISLAVTRLKLIPSLIPAAAITTINLLAWIVTEDGELVLGMSTEGIVLLTGVLFLLVPPVMFGIARIHRSKGARS